MSFNGLQDLPFISEEQVARLLDWPSLIDTMEHAMIEFSSGRVEQPVRQMVPVPGHDAIIAAMPAVGDAMGVKVVTLFHENAGTELPTHQAVILVFDKDNGSPLAIMDGRLITEMRTAAGSAAAARKLGNPQPEIVTIMGSGLQAAAHAKALANVRQWRELRLWARNTKNGKQLADQLGADFIADAQAAVAGADIVACTTSATKPILQGAWLKSGTFVSAVGWNTADGRELDDYAMAHTVIVESTDAAKNQAGNIRGSGCEIYAEIGEIYAGTKHAPAETTIVFDSVGIAIMDVAAAKLVYDRWIEQN